MPFTHSFKLIFYQTRVNKNFNEFLQTKTESAAEYADAAYPAA